MLFLHSICCFILIDIPVYLDERHEPIERTGAAVDASATNLVTASCTVPVVSATSSAVNLVAAADCQVAADECPVQSTTNSDGDDTEMLPKHGVKRRWSFEENNSFKRAFQELLFEKKMPSGDEISAFSKEIKTRSQAQIHTRLSNILPEKQKAF